MGVAAFFCFMFSWVELLLARTLTSVNAKPIVATMTRTVSASGMDWGVLAAAGVLTIVPGGIVIWFVRHYIATIFLPLIKSGVGVAAFFCFMFSWVELLLARTLTSVNAKPIVATMTRTVSASGMDWGVLAAAGVLTIVPGGIVIWFVRHYIAGRV